MRGKKLWKILGTAIGLTLVLLLLFVVAFVFNPFEGSLSDMRELVPRDVDYFVRKADLGEDFSEFPEPHFWAEFARTKNWRSIKRGPTYQQLQRDARVDFDQVAEQIRRGVQTVSEQSLGLVNPVGDVVGHDLIVAGKFGGSSIEGSKFCAYTRVTWKVRFAWGLLEWDSVREGIPDPQITMREDGTLALQARGQQPMWLARHLDCLLISNDEQLLRRSLDLAEGQAGADSFGGSSYYRDGVEDRLQQWSEDVGLKPNALEFYLRPDQLFPLTSWDDGWPDARHPSDMNQRVLASFLNLRGWRFLTGSLIFEPGDLSSLTTLGRIELNRNMHTGFQAEFFKADPQERREWLDSFLSMVPESACAAAALRMPAGDFLEEMFGAIDSDLRREVDQMLVKTGQYDGTDDLIEKIRPGLLPRMGFVFQRSREIGGGIETFEPSPAPHVAWVFWIDDRFRKPLKDLYDYLTMYHESLGFDNAWDLKVKGLASGDVAREFVNPNIPATGEIAIMLYRDFFVVSNSGPLITDMISARLQSRSIMQLPDYRAFDAELRDKLNGFVFLQGGRLVEVVDDYIAFLDETSKDPDQGWMLQVRSGIEREVLRSHYSGYQTVSQIPRDEREGFEQRVMAEMSRRWVDERQRVIGGERGGYDQLRALCGTFSSGFLEVTLDPQWMQWKSRFLFNF